MRAPDHVVSSPCAATAPTRSALWERLSQGATVVQPLAPSQWAPLYGMLTDRFGVTWVLDVAAPYNAEPHPPASSSSARQFPRRPSQFSSTGWW